MNPQVWEKFELSGHKKASTLWYQEFSSDDVITFALRLGSKKIFIARMYRGYSSLFDPSTTNLDPGSEVITFRTRVPNYRGVSYGGWSKFATVVLMDGGEFKLFPWTHELPPAVINRFDLYTPILKEFFAAKAGIFF